MKVLKIFKSLLYRILILVLIGPLGACSEECGYDSHAGYQLGKQNFDYLEGNMASILSFWDLALRMNTYLTALDEEGEDRVEELFPDYRLQQVNEHEWIGWKGQDSVFKIVTDDLALTTETAHWEIVGCRAPYEGQLTVLCSGLRTWVFHVSALQNRKWISDASLKINYNGEQTPRNFNDGDWIVSGVGKSMTDEEFALDNKKKVVVRKRISYLNKGDKVWIVSSDGYLLHTDVVRAERGRSYVDIDGILYWKRGLDGKHRNRNNYMQFAMTPEDGKKYVVYYPEGFKDNDL